MDRKFGLLFPGQGSQTVGMAEKLYRTQAAAKWVFDRSGRPAPDDREQPAGDLHREHSHAERIDRKNKGRPGRG